MKKKQFTEAQIAFALHQAESVTPLAEIIRKIGSEGRRRTKVIPRFPSKESCLRLVYASLITASKSWHGVKVKHPTACCGVLHLLSNR